MLDNEGSPPQPITVNADGTFLIPDLQPDVQYALTTDLNYPGYGPPGAAVTEAPGWFSVQNQNVEIQLGIFPWDQDDANFNVVLGQIYDLNGTVEQPVAGAEVGYFYWDDNSGCGAANPNILGSTLSDVNGNYRLDTLFLTMPISWRGLLSAGGRPDGALQYDLPIILRHRRAAPH